MGTYTTNYNLFMPTVGETGWGTLVNGNFTTIDTTMKSLSNRITAVESEVNGALSCTSVTTSGKVTGNGGIAGTTGTFSGAVTGASFNGVTIKANGVLTVTPTNNFNIKMPVSSYYSLTVLPPNNCTYTGSLQLKRNSNNSCRLGYIDGTQTSSNPASVEIAAGATYTLQFTNIKYLVVNANGYSDLYMTSFTLS